MTIYWKCLDQACDMQCTEPRKKVARYFSLALLSFSAWHCLAVGKIFKHFFSPLYVYVPKY